MAPRKVVLIVDDNAVVAKTLAALVQVEGYEAIMVNDAGEAIKLADSVAVDAALIEVMLQKVDGVERAIEICKRLPNCKILLMSGDPDAAILIERARSEGSNFEIIAKPAPAELLLARLAAMLS